MTLLLILSNWICYLVSYCVFSLTSHRYFWEAFSMSIKRWYTMKKGLLIHAKQRNQHKKGGCWNGKYLFMKNIWSSHFCEFGEVDDSSFHPLQTQQNEKGGDFLLDFDDALECSIITLEVAIILLLLVIFTSRNFNAFRIMEFLKFSWGAEKVKNSINVKINLRERKTLHSSEWRRKNYFHREV